jgi:hypothetical protein
MSGIPLGVFATRPFLASSIITLLFSMMVPWD